MAINLPNRVALFLPVLCFVALDGLAATHNVSTISELVAACKRAVPQDTIIVASGTYRITGASRISISERPGPVLVKGATGDPTDVIVEGLGQDDSAVQMVFDLDNSPGWTFQDLTTCNSFYHGFKFNGCSSNCVLRHVVMRDHGESGVKGTSNPALGMYPDRLLVEQCDIGFTTDRGGTRSVVEGIDGVGVNGWVIRSNRFINVLHGKEAAYAVFTKGNSSDTVIEANRFENCSIGASFGGGGTGPQYFRDNNREYEHRGGIVRNNLFIRCKDAAIYMNKADSCKIYNNTVFECALTIQLRYPQSSGWVRNNLIRLSPSNSDEPLVRVRDQAKLLADEGNRFAAPTDFVKPTGPDTQIDLHLSSISGAGNAGINLGPDVPTDFDGRHRPADKTWATGAYEFPGPASGIKAQRP
jgi:parallel beta-helix repeat protein